MAWTKAELKKIKKNLPTGWASILATKHGLAEGTVKNVMLGYQDNEAVVISAMELVLEHRETEKRLKAALNEIS